MQNSKLDRCATATTDRSVARTDSCRVPSKENRRTHRTWEGENLLGAEDSTFGGLQSWQHFKERFFEDKRLRNSELITDDSIEDTRRLFSLNRKELLHKAILMVVMQTTAAHLPHINAIPTGNRTSQTAYLTRKCAVVTSANCFVSFVALVNTEMNTFQ